MKLTFYLFNASVTDFQEALVTKKLTGEDPFEELPATKPLSFEAKAFFQKNKETQPKWLPFLEPYFDFGDVEVRNATNSFLLLIRVQGRVFAVTTGYGFTAIERSKLEMGFGLRVTLNEIDPDQIKEITARKIDTTTKHKQVLISRNSPLYDFDFELDEDLLSLIAGQPKDSSIARKLIGADSLRITADMTLPQLGSKCEALLAAFMKEDYKETFGFIDHMRLVKEPGLVKELDRLLGKALAERKRQRFLLAYPEIENLDRVETFVFTYQRNRQEVEEVDLDALYSFLDQFGIAEPDPRKFNIVGLDYDNRAVTRVLCLYDYAVLEVEYNACRYLLSLARWFELSVDFVHQIDDDVRAIPQITDSSYLPAMLRNQREEEYNREVAAQQHPRLICLDKALYAMDGHSKIEVCDLLSQCGDFICVKKYNGSSTLSHLFNQGVVSAILFNDDREYREFTHRFCPEEWGQLFDIDEPDKQAITFVFAIAAASRASLVDALPFFSKVTLRQARRSIERMGYKVKLNKINIVDSL